MKVYVIVHKDRHFGVEVEPFADRDTAVWRALDYLEQYGDPTYDDLTGAELNQFMRQDGWIFYGPYGNEGDSVTVIEKELQS
jgi:hypothetical protein